MARFSADLPTLLPGFLPRLWSFALCISGNKYDAEDLVQLACARALQRSHKLKPDVLVLNWMFSIVYFTWNNELRSRKASGCVRADWSDELLEIGGAPNAANTELSLLERRIIQVVSKLPDGLREVLFLVAVERLSYKETAEVLNLPISAVLTLLSRSRQAVGALFLR